MDERGYFLAEMMENILLPYEVSEEYEEEIVGEFENQVEEDYFRRFVALTGVRAFVLDLACGDGRHTLRLSESTSHVVALDLSPNNLKMAKKRCLTRENITFIQGSMFELHFSPKTFDGIWFSQAFEYVPPDKRERLLTSLNSILKPLGILYMSVETWMYPSLWGSLKELWGDFRLYFYWRFLKRKPLVWGEYLYCLSPKVAQVRCSCWHYHVHTDRWTLLKLLARRGFAVEKMDLGDGLIYVVCRKTTGSAQAGIA